VLLIRQFSASDGIDVRDVCVYQLWTSDAQGDDEKPADTGDN